MSTNNDLAAELELIAGDDPHYYQPLTLAAQRLRQASLQAINSTSTNQEIIRLSEERDYYRNCLLKSEAEIELLRRLFLDVTHYLSDGGGFAYDDMMATIEAIEAFKVSKG